MINFFLEKNIRLIGRIWKCFYMKIKKIMWTKIMAVGYVIWILSCVCVIHKWLVTSIIIHIKFMLLYRCWCSWWMWWIMYHCWGQDRKWSSRYCLQHPLWPCWTQGIHWCHRKVKLLVLLLRYSDLLFFRADLDPIYYCELLKACPIIDNGDASVVSFKITPNPVPRGTYTHLHFCVLYVVTF